MSLFELVLLAIGLSMDAFAVSICKGLALRNARWKEAAIVGLWFGGFQALMPLIGFVLGSRFAQAIAAFDHWIAFGLLLLIGASMVRESFGKESEDKSGASLAVKTMLLLAVATSIDALAVGVTFAFLSVRIVPAICLIGCVTFVLSAIGVKLGGVFGMKYKSRAELTGGIILILIGVKILLEHLGVL